jgi:glutamate-1-semialdehyde aminotransferase
MVKMSVMSEIAAKAKRVGSLKRKAAKLEAELLAMAKEHGVELDVDLLAEKPKAEKKEKPAKPVTKAA